MWGQVRVYVGDAGGGGAVRVFMNVFATIVYSATIYSFPSMCL